MDLILTSPAHATIPANFKKVKRFLRNLDFYFLIHANDLVSSPLTSPKTVDMRIAIYKNTERSFIQPLGRELFKISTL